MFTMPLNASAFAASASRNEAESNRTWPIGETGTATSANFVPFRVTVPDAVSKVSAARCAIGSFCTSRPSTLCESWAGLSTVCPSTGASIA